MPRYNPTQLTKSPYARKRSTKFILHLYLTYHQNLQLRSLNNILSLPNHWNSIDNIICIIHRPLSHDPAAPGASLPLTRPAVAPPLAHVAIFVNPSQKKIDLISSSTGEKLLTRGQCVSISSAQTLLFVFTTTIPADSPLHAHPTS